jgi:DNA-binding protein HU-beta
MTKAELVSKIAKDAGISQKAADLVLNSLINAIHESLKGPDRQIRIPDLGTFKVSKRNARVGVNPRTGEKINIPEAQVPGFSAAKALKEAVKAS